MRVRSRGRSRISGPPPSSDTTEVRVDARRDENGPGSDVRADVANEYVDVPVELRIDIAVVMVVIVVVCLLQSVRLRWRWRSDHLRLAIFSDCKQTRSGVSALLPCFSTTLRAPHTSISSKRQGI